MLQLQLDGFKRPRSRATGRRNSSRRPWGGLEHWRLKTTMTMTMTRMTMTVIMILLKNKLQRRRMDCGRLSRMEGLMMEVAGR